jgi:hypothetical protein
MSILARDCGKTVENGRGLPAFFAAQKQPAQDDNCTTRGADEDVRPPHRCTLFNSYSFLSPGVAS